MNKKGTYIDKSSIHGNGLFASEDINNADGFFGITHMHGSPTNIGGYYNHSETPNARVIKMGNNHYITPGENGIKAGEEITVDYRNQPELEQPDSFQHGGPVVKQRRGTRKNADGTESSHLMRAEQLEDGNWVGFPSLFQDSKPYSDDTQNWVDMSNEEDWMNIYEEARRRGEVYEFGKDKEAALAFGKGSWKDQLPKSDYNMERAQELGYASDESGHMPSVDEETGMWLKSKEHPTAFKEYMYGQLNKDIGSNYNVVVNPEGHFGEEQLQYVPRKDGGSIYGMMCGGKVKKFQDGGPNPPASNYKRLYGHAKDYGVGTDRGLIDPNTGYKYFPEESPVPEDLWNTSRFLYQPFIAGEKQGVHNATYDESGEYKGVKELPTGFKSAKEDISNYYEKDLGQTKGEARSSIMSKMQDIRKMHRAQNKMGDYYFTEFQNPDHIFDETLGTGYQMDPNDEYYKEPLAKGEAKRAYTKFQKAWRGTSGKEARENSRNELEEARIRNEIYKKEQEEYDTGKNITNELNTFQHGGGIGAGAFGKRVKTEPTRYNKPHTTQVYSDSNINTSDGTDGFSQDYTNTGMQINTWDDKYNIPPDTMYRTVNNDNEYYYNTGNPNTVPNDSINKSIRNRFLPMQHGGGIGAAAGISKPIVKKPKYDPYLDPNYTAGSESTPPFTNNQDFVKNLQPGKPTTAGFYATQPKEEIRRQLDHHDVSHLSFSNRDEADDFLAYKDRESERPIPQPAGPENNWNDAPIVPQDWLWSFMIGPPGVGNVVKEGVKRKIVNPIADAMMPYTHKKIIHRSKEAFNKAFTETFPSEEGTKRLARLGLSPQGFEKSVKLNKPKLTIGRSPHRSHFDPDENIVNIDPFQLRKLKRKAYKGLSPEAVVEHELGHFLQKEATINSLAYRQDLSKYNKDFKMFSIFLKKQNPKISEEAIKKHYNIWSEVTNTGSGRTSILKRLGKKPSKMESTKFDDMLRHNLDPTIKSVDYVGEVPLSRAAKNYNFFVKQLTEPFAHGREMRQAMVDKGIIKGPYDKITNDQIKRFIKENPKDRISSFIGKSDKNIHLLREFMNKAPAAIPAAGLLGHGLNTKDESIKAYQFGGPLPNVNANSIGFSKGKGQTPIEGGYSSLYSGMVGTAGYDHSWRQKNMRNTIHTLSGDALHGYNFKRNTPFVGVRGSYEYGATPRGKNYYGYLNIGGGYDTNRGINLGIDAGAKIPIIDRHNNTLSVNPHAGAFVQTKAQGTFDDNQKYDEMMSQAYGPKQGSVGPGWNYGVNVNYARKLKNDSRFNINAGVNFDALAGKGSQGVKSADSEKVELAPSGHLSAGYTFINDPRKRKIKKRIEARKIQDEINKNSVPSIL